MGKQIEIYVTTKEVVTQTTLEGRPLPGAGNVHYCAVKEISKTEKMISEEEKQALTLIQEFARENGFTVQVIDLATLKGKLRARRNGINSTPTIIVGKSRLVGVPKEGEIEALLKQ